MDTRQYALSRDKTKVAVPYDPDLQAMLLKWRVPHKRTRTRLAAPMSDVSWKILHKHGLDVPSPMSLNYQYPGFTPMAHQIIGANHLAYRSKAQLWADIGTGKTAMSLWAMDYVMARHRAPRTLVLAPKSTLIDVWATHLSRLTPWRRYDVLDGSTTKKLQQIAHTKAEVIVTNHDATRYIGDALGEWAPTIIIVDEQTVYGNIQSKRTKGLRAMIGPATRVWFLTGRPMPDSPMNVHGPAHITSPTTVPKQVTAFRPLVMWQTASGFWKPKREAPEVIANLLGDSVLRIKREDCFDLPPTQYTAMKCDPSPQLVSTIRKLKAEAEIEMADGTLTAATEGVYRIKISQAACGAVKMVDNDGKDAVAVIDCASKFDTLADILDGTDHPVLLFTPYKAPIPTIEAWLKKREVTYRTVTGESSLKKRTDAFRAVADGDAKVLVAVPGAMAHGVNSLIVADTIVWWGAAATNRDYEQANGRIIRSGQTKNTYIMHLASCKLEKIAYQRLINKQSLEGSLLELVRSVV